jgi:hypothetical protein
MSLVPLAKELAKHFHKGQKYGKHPYFEWHLCGVSSVVYRKIRVDMSEYNMEQALCVAYLHDILEDTDCELTTLENIFGEVISDAVLLMTKDIGTSRGDYLFNIKQNPLARFVKVCDAEFNRDSCLYEGNTKRAEYYQSTIDYLLGE